jgi:hypothetical protein
VLSCEQTICATIDDETKANDGQEEQKIQFAMLVSIRVACNLYKLAHAFQCFHCLNFLSLGNILCIWCYMNLCVL